MATITYPSPVRLLKVEELLAGGDSIYDDQPKSSHRRKYAVLSHRWKELEISFQDSPPWRRCASSEKILGTARQARRDGIPFIWIDTCCIDKQSSSELSEAINSMYSWYGEAERCYVYLHDVTKANMDASFPRSEWFTRGWTLQELLAPRTVMFYDRDWQYLGDKSSLKDVITRATGIDPSALDTGDLSRFCIAQKMSWAAQRVTTRIEDQAYCLMGLFDVNMSLLYGEGSKAFLRLQEEIIKESDDHSIFAWTMPPQIMMCGLLALSPACFAKCGDLTVIPLTQKSPYSFTNRGLSIKLGLTPWSTGTYLASLDVQGPEKRSAHRHIPCPKGRCIFLRRLTEDDQYARVQVKCEDGQLLDSEDVFPNEDRIVEVRRLFIRKTIKAAEISSCRFDHKYGFKVWSGCFDYLYSIENIVPRSGQIFEFKRGGSDEYLELDFSKENQGLKSMKLSFDFDFNPTCLLRDSTEIDADQISRAESAAKPNIIERGVVIRPHDHNGTWYLRGDRHHGLDVVLKLSSGSNGPLLCIKLVELEDGCIWEVSIDSLGMVFANDAATISDHLGLEAAFLAGSWLENGS